MENIIKGLAQRAHC